MGASFFRNPVWELIGRGVRGPSAGAQLLPLLTVWALFFLGACGGISEPDRYADAGVPDDADGGPPDAPELGPDSGPSDAEPSDLWASDQGPGEDVAVWDLGPVDSGDSEVGVSDTGVGDAATSEVGTSDLGPVDTGPTFFEPGSPAAGIGVWDWSPIASGPDRFAPDEAVWQGLEVMFTGGGSINGCDFPAFYNPTTDRWRGAEIRGTRPSYFEDFQIGSALLFTGREVLDFGGFNAPCGVSWYANDIRALEPRPDIWGRRTSGPFVMVNPGFVWTGHELLVFPHAACSASGCAYQGARYDPVQDRWRTMSLTNQPNDTSSYRPAVWTGQEMLVWGGTRATSGRYNPSTDTWSALTVPPFALGAGDALWLGSNMFVWDGQVGALFSPSSNRWTQTSTVGAPAGVSHAHVVRTGGDAIVVGQGGGARYLRAQDRWVSIDTHDPHFPSGWGSQPHNVVWTGQDLLVVRAGTPSLGWKYGPKLTGRVTCNGGRGPQRVRIDTPATRRAFWGTINVRATATPAVSGYTWSLNGTTLPWTTAAGSISSSALSSGATSLRVTVQDATGHTACHEITLFVDQPPTVQLQSPLPNETVRTSTSIIRARCTDDGSQGCWIRLHARANNIFANVASSGSVLSEALNVSSANNQTLEIELQAYDSRYQESAIVRQNNSIALSRALRMIEDRIPGDVCDVNSSHLLWADRIQRHFYLRNLSSHQDTRIARLPQSLSCGKSRLVGISDALLVSADRVYFYRSGSLGTGWASEFTRVNMPWVASVFGNQLELRNANTTRVETVASGPSSLLSNRAFDVAADGTVWYLDGQRRLRRYRPGGTTLTLGVSPSSYADTTYGPELTATSHEAIWVIQDPATSMFGLAAGTTTGTVALFVPQYRYGDLRRNENPGYNPSLFRAGDYLVLRRPTSLVPQLRRMGVEQTVPIQRGCCQHGEAKGVTTGGNVVGEMGSDYLVWERSTNTLTGFGNAGGRLVVRGHQVFVQYVQTLFEVVP